MPVIFGVGLSRFQFRRIAMHTILGANGVIAQELARALTEFTQDIRQVSRTPLKVNPTDETFVCRPIGRSSNLKCGVR